MRLSRSGQALAIFAVAVVAILAPQVAQLWAELTGPSFPDALLALGSLLAMVLATWVLLIATLVMFGVSAHALTRFTPALLRGALFAGAAGVLAIGPAQAGQISGSEARLPHSVAGLPLPDRPNAQSAAPPAAVRQTLETKAVTVRPGDTLWAIAARSLPDGASNAQIAAATRAWHDANRDVIGAEPHLIFPAQRLIPPTGKDLP